MMRYLFFLLFFPLLSAAQSTPKQLIEDANQRFAKVLSYRASINLNFQIPGVQLEPIDGKVYYKKPSKFRIHAKGIIFLPKQNPYYALESVRDTNSFTAVPSGSEIVNGRNTRIVSVIPTANADDLILAKLWIDESQQLIHRAQLTTKTNGTITIEQKFGLYAKYGLPDVITFEIDVAKFKIPKAVSMELNAKAKAQGQSTPQNGSGAIKLSFSNYELNIPLDESVFEENH